MQRGFRALINQAGLNAKTVVRKETGEFIKTMVRLTPPKSRAKAMEKLRNEVEDTFDVLREGQNSAREDISGGKIGPAGIRWYSVSPAYLSGVAPESDQRTADTETLRRFYYSTQVKRTGEGVVKGVRIIKPFKYPRKFQKVRLSMTVLTTAAQIKKLATRIGKNFGRLKAGFLASVAAGVIRLTGGMPPAWVTRHMSGVRGSFVDEIENKGNPRFTVVNFALGVGTKKMRGIIQAAVNIRGKAMVKNALFFTKGKKRISDYK
jgi:hypothetical protein